MEKKIKFLTLALFGLAIVALAAGYVGYSLGGKRAPGGSGTGKVAAAISAVFDSGLVNSFDLSVLGKISAISDGRLVVEDRGKTLAVALSENTNFMKTSAGAVPPQLVKLGDLRVGDKVEVLLSVSSDGEVKVLNVMVLPAVLPPASSPSPVPAE